MSGADKRSRCGIALLVGAFWFLIVGLGSLGFESAFGGALPNAGMTRGLLCGFCRVPLLAKLILAVAAGLLTVDLLNHGLRQHAALTAPSRLRKLVGVGGGVAWLIVGLVAAHEIATCHVYPEDRCGENYRNQSSDNRNV